MTGGSAPGHCCHLTDRLDLLRLLLTSQLNRHDEIKESDPSATSIVGAIPAAIADNRCLACRAIKVCREIEHETSLSSRSAVSTTPIMPVNVSAAVSVF
jgi:hypothetical protein